MTRLLFLNVKTVTVPFACVLSALSARGTYADIVDFESPRWVLKNAETVEHLGRNSFRGTAYLDDVEFENGVIEVDMAVDGTRCYPGIIFRMQSEREFEQFYIRPHVTYQFPDALQYAPVFNGETCWQLYNGEGVTARANLPLNRWMHLKMEIKGTQARVYLDNATDPALVISDLKHGRSKGSIGVHGGKDWAAYFSNFSYRLDDSLEFPEPAPITMPPHTITDWEISSPFPAGEIAQDAYPQFLTIFNAGWRKAEPEANGLVNLSRLVTRQPGEPATVLARTIFQSDRKRDMKFSFGYSDNITIFFNGKRVFTGRSAYHSRDESFLGTIGFHDDVHLTLEKGLNELFFLVTDGFGGWGFMCKSERRLHRPAIQHELTTKLWETEPVFKTPESVLYDPKRDVLYVSNYDRFAGMNRESGFLSKVRTDGEVEQLEWVTGLGGPLGMVIHNGALFVVEVRNRSLAEIDLDAGTIRRRIPIPRATFLNDVTVDSKGYLYVTDTSRSRKANDIFRCIDGKCETWLKRDDVFRGNGIFFDGSGLVLGNNGESFFDAVDLDTGRVRHIASLGAGIIDGIRGDSAGNYLASLWMGKVFRISPTGDVVEILNAVEARRNIADFEFIKGKNLLVLPTFEANTVMAYRVKDETPSQD
ncbi:MAG: SMP-30/gluconolactonase/LRE family protein [Phycisphaerales bacterium]|nr:MAG: SMP-30/gluconolactonase/LRE family protein [Phycisphaerales bacterium]